MKKINWHIMDDSEFYANGCFYKLKGGTPYFIHGNQWRISMFTISELKEEEDYQNRPTKEEINQTQQKEVISSDEDGFTLSTKPVYTQEIKNNGELPPIGSRFIDTAIDEEVLSIGYDLPFDRVIYRKGDDIMNSEYYSAVLSECEPIGTRTDTQKLKDKIIDSFRNYDEPLSDNITRCQNFAIEYTVDYINNMSIESGSK